MHPVCANNSSKASYMRTFTFKLVVTKKLLPRQQLAREFFACSAFINIAIKSVLLSCTGPRTAKGIADALTSALPSTHISKLKDAASYSNFTTTSALPKVVLFTDKTKTSALYKSLSLRFKGRLTFAEVNNKASDVIEQQGVEQFPKVVVLDGDKTQEYSGR